MSICLSVPLSPVYPLKAETRGRRADAAAATQDWRSVFGARGSEGWMEVPQRGSGGRAHSRGQGAKSPDADETQQIIYTLEKYFVRHTWCHCQNDETVTLPAMLYTRGGDNC